MPTEEFKTLDFDQLTADINANFDEMFAMSQMFDPNTTVAQVLSTYYYKGVFTVDASELTPETTLLRLCSSTLCRNRPCCQNSQV